MENIIKYDPEIVKATYDLYGNYCFMIEDVTKIVNGKSIYKVLANKICFILEEIQETNKEYDDEYGLGIEVDETIFEEEEIKKDLKSDKEKVIDLLIEYRKKLDDKANEDLINDVNSIISIIEKLENIIQKYEGKFKEKKEKIIANSLLKRSEYKDIIDKELFNKVQKKLNIPKMYKVKIIKRGYGSFNFYEKRIERQLNEMYEQGYELVNANLIYDNNIMAILKKKEK